MKYIVIIFMIVSHSLDLLACGRMITGFEQTDNNVLIKIATPKKETIVTDDDGFLSLSLAAAYCQYKHPRPWLQLPAKDEACIKKAYDDAGIKDEKEMISFEKYQSADLAKTKTIEALNKACGFTIDAFKSLWSSAFQMHFKTPMFCKDDIKDLVKKAVAKNTLEMKYRTSKEFLDQLSSTDDSQKAEYVTRLKNENDLAKKFEELVLNDKATVKDFDDWVPLLAPVSKARGYQDSESLTESDKDAKESKPTLATGSTSARKDVSLRQILTSLNAPFYFSKQDRKTCSIPFDGEKIKLLAKAEWTFKPANRSEESRSK